jgi:hypothetical protein
MERGSRRERDAVEATLKPDSRSEGGAATTCKTRYDLDGDMNDI